MSTIEIFTVAAIVVQIAFGAIGIAILIYLYSPIGKKRGC
jgi:hypothetical protein